MNVVALRELAASLPAGTAVPVPREWLLELLEAGTRDGVVEQQQPDRMLDADQVSALLGTARKWVYSHAQHLGGKRLSRRCLRFPESAVRRYLERRR